MNRSAGINRGTLGIEIGYSETLCAAVKSGKLVVERLPGFGLGEGFSNLLTTNQIEEIIKWLPTEIERSFVEQYILNKSLYPFTTPSSEMELEIEYTIAQQFLKRLLSRLHNKFLDPGKHKKTPIRTSFERIIISGSLFSSAKDDAKKTLALLNGIQPVGAAAILLDPNQILGALGAAAGENPLMAVQVLDSGIFNHLCTVVAANSRAPDGRRILRVRMVYQNGNEREFEIKKGDFFKLPLMRGETAELLLHPFHGCDVGLGRPGRGGRVRVMGGNVGLIIDARGRPISVRTGTSDRAAQFQTWIQSLSGEI
jgi:hypothetical protein